MDPARPLVVPQTNAASRDRRPPDPSNAASQYDGIAAGLTLLHFLELRIDDVVVAACRLRLGLRTAARAARARRCAATGRRLLRRLRLGIDLLAELLARSHQRLGLGFY